MTTEKRPCSNCEDVRDVTLITHEETTLINSREVTFSANYYRCLSCGEEFDTADTMDANLEAAQLAYEERYLTISAEEIVELRTKYNAGQKAFGRILGFGDATINSYEQNKTRPTPSHLLLLKMAKDSGAFRMMYEENKHKIGRTQRRKIENSSGFTADGVVGMPHEQQWRYFAQNSFARGETFDTASNYVSEPGQMYTRIVCDDSAAKELP